MEQVRVSANVNLDTANASPYLFSLSVLRDVCVMRKRDQCVLEPMQKRPKTRRNNYRQNYLLTHVYCRD